MSIWSFIPQSAPWYPAHLTPLWSSVPMAPPWSKLGRAPPWTFSPSESSAEVDSLVSQEAFPIYSSVVPSSPCHSLFFLSTGPSMESGCFGPPAHPSMDYISPSYHLGVGEDSVIVLNSMARRAGLKAVLLPVGWENGMAKSIEWQDFRNTKSVNSNKFIFVKGHGEVATGPVTVPRLLGLGGSSQGGHYPASVKNQSLYSCF
ncbi:unnamed protein product [Leuciscus chuanchicus]